MGRKASIVVLLSLASAAAQAQTGIHELNVDVAASGLLPFTWASDSPSLVHAGYEAKLGLEYDSPISVPFRFEAGYLSATASRISSSGELYRGWDGLRLALLGGYTFDPIRVSGIGELSVSLLGGAAMTAAAYAGTSLAFAYPSIVLEPRLALNFLAGRSRNIVHGPLLSLPIELMYRAGTHTLAPGLNLGWRYRLGASK